MANGLKDLLDRVLFVQVGPEDRPRAGTPSRIETLDFSFLTFDELNSQRAAADGNATYQVMSLRSFKEALGEEWTSHQRTIALATENTIFRHLAQRDRCCQEDDDTYLFLFDTASQHVAGERLERVTTDLMRCLIGDRFVGARAQMAEVTAADITGEDGKLDAGKLTAALDAAPVVTLETNAEGVPALVEVEVARPREPGWQEIDRDSTELRMTEIAGGKTARLVESEVAAPRPKKEWSAIEGDRPSRERDMEEIAGRRADDPAWQEAAARPKSARLVAAEAGGQADRTTVEAAVRRQRQAEDWQALPAERRRAGGEVVLLAAAAKSGDARLVGGAAGKAADWQEIPLTPAITHEFPATPADGGRHADRDPGRLVTDRAPVEPVAGDWSTAWASDWQPEGQLDGVVTDTPAAPETIDWPSTGERDLATDRMWPGETSARPDAQPTLVAGDEGLEPEIRLVETRAAAAPPTDSVDWPPSATREIAAPPLLTGYRGKEDPEILWFSRTVVEVDGVDTAGSLARQDHARRAADDPDWGLSRDRQPKGTLVDDQPARRRRDQPALQTIETAARPEPPLTPVPGAGKRAPVAPVAPAAPPDWVETIRDGPVAAAGDPPDPATTEPGSPREPAWGPLAWPPPGAGRARAGLPDALAAAVLPPGLTVGYWPVWNADRHAVDTFVATPMRADRSGAVPSRVVTLLSGAPAGLKAAVDLALLSAALRRIEENIEERKRLMLVVPLRFSTLGPESLEAVRAIMDGFSAAASARYLYLELFDWPAELSEAMLAPLRHRLPSLCRDVLLRVDGNGPPARAVAALRAAAVGFDLGPAGRRRCPLLPRPAGGLKTYVWGVDDPDGLDQVVADGHWLTSGPELGPPVGVPNDEHTVHLSAVVDPARRAARAAARAG